MKDLTEQQIGRLDAATTRVDQMLEKRPLSISTESQLAAIIDTFDTAIKLLEAGETIHVSVRDQDGIQVADARLVLEPAPR